MPENLRKASLYFRNTGAYWRPVENAGALAVDPGELGRYPLNLEPRLTSGHFIHFDERGLPVRVGAEGQGFVHNYTTICGFALAHWDRYLRFGRQGDRDLLLCAADYMMDTADITGDLALLRNDVGEEHHTGNPSALAQGQALSVLCRAWRATGQSKYLGFASRLLPAFDLPVERGGVLGHITRAGVPWFEEYVEQPLNHVLNGMLIALFGLDDFFRTACQQHAQDLFGRGVASVAAALPLFDSGFWSWYQVSEDGRSYVASMGYHMLHVRLLNSLSQRTRRSELKNYAERFEGYARRPVNRLRAVMQMVQSKYKNKKERLITKPRSAESAGKTAEAA